MFDVEKFIKNMVCSKDIEDRFLAGFCWHFAHLLKDTFGRGEVCLAAPFSHFVFVDTDEKKWDAGGEYVGEAYYFIPEHYLPEKELVTYRHVPGQTSEGMGRTECISMMKAYCKMNRLTYDKTVEDYLWPYEPKAEKAS